MRFVLSAAILGISAGMLLNAAEAADSLQAVDTTFMSNAAQAHLTVPQLQPSALERNVYWSTWWVYHASFVSDFTLTGMIIDRGGREGDPLYTLFGERNIAGVMGSAIVFHAVFSLISWKWYKEADKRSGAWRFLMFATAAGINSYFLAVHTYATFGNINVYNKLSR
jgi:hypothetical protein